ncbi:MAG: T9SS type A sorting domain-containing protein [Proteobacteria bacterium]|nr:MAG: T9SS type A sorting domain-containing protein [Pseudomonadota bacterium]
MTVSNTNASTAGTYNIVITGASGAITKTASLYLQLYNSAFGGVTLTSPANNAVTVDPGTTLTWTADANATAYDVQVATDAAFTNIVSSGSVTSTSFSPVGLAQGTTYFWRVLPKNISCQGQYSSAATFQTGTIACDTYTSANVPVAIIASGPSTVNSTLAVTANNSISDINVTVAITHTYVSDLTLTLISPTGTQIPLAVQACGDGANINVTFDDAGTPFVCSASPAISGTLQPSSPLSVLNGTSSAGTWTLRVNDAYNGDGGSITAWSLNICNVQALGLNENKLQDFAIYPNPNNGNFNVRFVPESSDAIQINVHDIRGRQIFGKTYANNGLFEQNLQLDGASSGIYMVTVSNGATKEVRKIVIN